MQSGAVVWLKRFLATVAAVGIGCWQGPAFVANLRPPRTVIYDFFQEWAREQASRELVIPRTAP